MKMKFVIQILSLLLVVNIFTSCLDGDQMNTPPGASSAIAELTFNTADGTTVNTGLNYFSGQSLLFPVTHVADTVTFAVTIQSPTSVDKDVTFTLSDPIEAAADDYYATDSIDYIVMPDSLFEILTKTTVVKAGKTYAEFKVKFNTGKTDHVQNYILPLTVTNDGGIPLSSNYGIIYFHLIGNPIAGSYNWDFIRYSNPEGSGSPDGQTVYGRETVFAPINPTTISVATGYYTKPNYIISFVNTNGVLSKFKAVIDPKQIEKDWTPAGIVLGSGPTITVNEDYTVFTLHYTTATRNCTDIYTRK